MFVPVYIFSVFFMFLVHPSPGWFRTNDFGNPRPAPEPIDGVYVPCLANPSALSFPAIPVCPGSPYDIFVVFPDQSMSLLRLCFSVCSFR